MFRDGGLQGCAGFHINQFGITQYCRISIERVVELYDVQIESAESQLVEAGFETGGVEQITEDDGNTWAWSSVEELSDGFEQAGLRRGSGESPEELHEGEDAFASAGQRKLLDDPGGTGEDGDAIEIGEGDPCECCGELPGQIEFASIGEIHAVGAVEEEPQVQVLFFLEASDEQISVASVDIPVEVSEVFSGAVFAVVGEFDTGSCLSSSALGQQLSSEHAFRHERKVFEACQKVGRKEHGGRFYGRGVGSANTG
jgi:hypothetical protein